MARKVVQETVNDTTDDAENDALSESLDTADSQGLKDGSLETLKEAADNSAAEDDAELVQQPVAEEIGPEIAGAITEETELDVTVGASAAGETFGISIIVSLVVLAATIAITVAVAAAKAANDIEISLSSDVLVWNSGYQPDIAGMMADASARTRLQEAWTILTYPDRPSILPMPSSVPSDRALIDTPYVSGVAQPSTGTKNFKYLDWLKHQYTPRLYGSYFMQSGTVNVVGKGIVSYENIHNTLYYTGWDSNRYTASRVGKNFIVTKGATTQADGPCPQSVAGALSNPANAAVCFSYVTDTLKIKDVNGDLHALTVGTIPAFNIAIGPRFYTGDAARFPQSSARPAVPLPSSR